VNGERVNKIEISDKGFKSFIIGTNWWTETYLDIKEILTHERYEAEKYVVE
jgi:hypothetical protein